jgi:hypothetical protein
MKENGSTNVVEEQFEEESWLSKALGLDNHQELLKPINAALNAVAVNNGVDVKTLSTQVSAAVSSTQTATAGVQTAISSLKGTKLSVSDAVPVIDAIVNAIPGLSTDAKTAICALISFVVSLIG